VPGCCNGTPRICAEANGPAIALSDDERRHGSKHPEEMEHEGGLDLVVVHSLVPSHAQTTSTGLMGRRPIPGVGIVPRADALTLATEGAE